jgi:putative ABC transport system ATP-binding protein
VLDLFDGLHTDRGLNLIVVTHSQEVSQRAQRVLSIRDGRLVEDRLTGVAPARLDGVVGYKT